MRLSKRLLILMLLLALLLLIPSAIPIFKSLEKDPPSIFNLGPGGVSLYISKLALHNEVSVIFSFSDLRKYDPEDHALLVVGPDRIPNDAGELIKWVKNGGLLVVLDELDHSSGVLSLFGMLYGNTHYVIDVAYCTYANVNTTILLNVFREVYARGQGDTICVYNGAPIATSVGYGKGKVVAIGDSSLVINNLCVNMPEWCNANGIFVHMITEGRKLILYEGGRDYRVIGSEMMAYAMSVTLNTLSGTLRLILEESYTLRLLLVTLLLFLPTSCLILVFGLPKPVSVSIPVRKRKTESDKDRGIGVDLEERLSKVWTRG